MRIIIPIVIAALALISCSTKENIIKAKKTVSVNTGKLTYEDLISDYKLFPLVNNKFIGKDSFQIINWPNGIPKIKGGFAYNNKGKVTSFRNGEFEEYFENGKIRSKGHYEIGRYIQCCFGGLCSQYYNYKFGEWKYFYESGELRSKVNYEVRKFPISTSCEGGDTINFGQIDLKSIQNLDEQGRQTQISKEYLEELETVRFNEQEYFFDELSIEDGRVKLKLTNSKD